MPFYHFYLVAVDSSANFYAFAVRRSARLEGGREGDSNREHHVAHREHLPVRRGRQCHGPVVRNGVGHLHCPSQQRLVDILRLPCVCIP